MYEYIMDTACDLICKYPDKLTQEELDRKCERCPLEKALYRMFHIYEGEKDVSDN